MHVETNSQKLKNDQKFLIGYGKKWAQPVWSEDSEIERNSRMNRLNKLIFCMLVEIQES